MTRNLHLPIFFLSAVLIMIFSLPAMAGLKERVDETVLPNGLKVILLEDHKAPVLTFHVWYRVGARDERWGKTGLSHLLEHMMFKGTRKITGVEFNRIIKENGGNDNAFTSKDYTGYFMTLAADRVSIPIRLESDRMRNLLLREKDFQTEKMVVMEERRLRTEDNPQAFLAEQLEAAAFQIHPYHWPTIGWMEDIRNLTLEDLKSWYRTYYNPANAFIVVLGDFKKAELLPLIRNAFGSIPKGAAPSGERDREPPQTGERRLFLKKEAQLPCIFMGYHVPNLTNSDGYALEVIEAILSGGKSSRLYRNLVLEKHIALDADADNSLLSRDSRLFYLSATPLPGKDTAIIEKSLTDEIERLQKEPVGEQELEKAKNQIESSFVYGQDSIYYQALILAQHEIASSWKAIDDYIPSIRKVTAEDLMRVARLYLVPDNRTTGILVPLSSKKEKPVSEGSPLRQETIR
jgi:zinc protease